MKTVIVDRVEVLHNTPIDGEAYAIVTDGARYAFVWGSEYPYADDVPTDNIIAGESGIEWYRTEDEARNVMKQTLEAVKN